MTELDLGCKGHIIISTYSRTCPCQLQKISNTEILLRSAQSGVDPLQLVLVVSSVIKLCKDLVHMRYVVSLFLSLCVRVCVCVCVTLWGGVCLLSRALIQGIIQLGTSCTYMPS